MTKNFAKHIYFCSLPRYTFHFLFLFIDILFSACSAAKHFHEAELKPAHLPLTLQQNLTPQQFVSALSKAYYILPKMSNASF